MKMGCEEKRVLGGRVYGVDHSGRGGNIGVEGGDNVKSEIVGSGVSCEINSVEFDSIVEAASMVCSMKNDKLTKRDREMIDGFKKIAIKPFGYGYEVGDMVWGKVISYPWWPGQIFNEAFALSCVSETKREGHVLVSFFGDNSYGWFDPLELIPFDDNYVEKLKQTNARSFVSAVEEAEREVGRRAALGLTCRCRNPCNFRPESVEGYFAVDVCGYQPGEVYTVKQIERARDEFWPVAMLYFVKGLALMPCGNLRRSVAWMKDLAIVLAYRKAVFEEFDQAYVQAFGVQLQPKHMDSIGVLNVQEKVPSQASLSGPLEIAEASIKIKNQLKRDKSISKEIDELDVSRIYHVSDGRQSFSSKSMYEEKAALAGGDYGVRRRAPSVSIITEFPGQVDVHHTLGSMNAALSPDHTGKETTTANMKPLHDKISLVDVMVDWKFDGMKNSDNLQQSQPKLKNVAEDCHHLNSDAVLHRKVLLNNSDSTDEKPRGSKRPVEELNSEQAAMLDTEKKKEFKLESGLEHPHEHLRSSKKEALAGKSARKSSQTDLVHGQDSLIDQQGKANRSPHMFSSDYEATRQMVDRIKAKLPQLLSDLLVLALHPFHNVEQNIPAPLLQFFLKFRSFVYQKNFAVAPSAKTALIESRRTESLACSVAAKSPGLNARDLPSAAKPPKKRLKIDDYAKVGRNISISDCREETSMKEVKTPNELKSLSAENKLGNQKGRNGKEMDMTVPTNVIYKTTKKPVIPSRADEPTMLVMKFDRQSPLPSVSELKARFARFGPLHSAPRVFWKSSTCRIVFKCESNAKAAYKYAFQNRSLFGGAKVNYYLQAPEAQAPELPKSGKQLAENAPNKVPELTPRRTGNSTEPRSMVPRQQQQLQRVQQKSCLRKPLGNEAQSSAGVPSETPHVKLLLGGDESGRREQLVISSNVNGDYPNSSSLSPHATINVDSHHFQEIIPSPLPLLPLPNQISDVLENHEINQFVEACNVQHLQLQARNHICTTTPTTQSVDVSNQMLNLMMRCSEIVAGLNCWSGYMPCHR